MKRQKIYGEYKEEIDTLSEELDPREMFILGFLKGFDRKVLKDWQKEGLFDSYSGY